MTACGCAALKQAMCVRDRAGRPAGVRTWQALPAVRVSAVWPHVQRWVRLAHDAGRAYRCRQRGLQRTARAHVQHMAAMPVAWAAHKGAMCTRAHTVQLLRAAAPFPWSSPQRTPRRRLPRRADRHPQRPLQRAPRAPVRTPGSPRTQGHRVRRPRVARARAPLRGRCPATGTVTPRPPRS